MWINHAKLIKILKKIVSFGLMKTFCALSLSSHFYSILGSYNPFLGYIIAIMNLDKKRSNKMVTYIIEKDFLETDCKCNEFIHSALPEASQENEPINKLILV